MPPAKHPSLWDLIVRAGLTPGFALSDSQRLVALGELGDATSLGIALEEARGQSILIYADRQLSAALAAIELDGIARRIVLCPPDLAVSQLDSVIANAEANIILSENPDRLQPHAGDIRAAACGLPVTARHPRPGASEHLLRYPPLWRVADSAARLDRRRADGVVGGRRAGWRFSDPAGCFRRDPYFRHAVALAAGADEPDDWKNLARLCAAFG